MDIDYKAALEYGKKECYCRGCNAPDLTLYDEDADACEECKIMNFFEASKNAIKKMIDYGWVDIVRTNRFPRNGDIVLVFAKVCGKKVYGVCRYSEEEGFIDGINPPSLFSRYVIAWKRIDPYIKGGDLQ